METIIFIYHKDGKLKGLDLVQAKTENDQLIADGWEHTRSLNPCVFIEYLFNQCDPYDRLNEIHELSKRINEPN